MPVSQGSSVTMKRMMVYSSTCSRVNSTPCVTGSMGMSTLA
jgi:hypothetical protein